MSVPNEISYDIDAPPHAADLYDFASVADTIDGLDAVTAADVARYHEQGFIAVRNAFTLEEVQVSLAAAHDLIAGRIPEFQNIQFHQGAQGRLDALSFDERIDSVRRLLYFVEYEPRLKSFAHKPQLLAVIEQLLGAAPEMFQDMALIKPPQGREKPWHQDHAYFELSPRTRVVGVWIALDLAGVENGCMRLLPGWHRRGGFPHFQIRDLQICDTEMEGRRDQRVAVPLDPGACLIFDSYLPHGTPSNFTSSRRRALQFHYRAPGAEQITSEERVAIWGGESNNLSC